MGLKTVLRKKKPIEILIISVHFTSESVRNESADFQQVWGRDRCGTRVLFLCREFKGDPLCFLLPYVIYLMLQGQMFTLNRTKVSKQ